MKKRQGAAHWWEQYKVNVPAGKAGAWAVKRFTVTAEEAKWANLSMLFNGEGSRRVEPGTYTRLTRGNVCVMSDTRAEIMDHLDAIRMATGQVLINGLGLGMVLAAVMAKPEVERVTVVELSEEVIKLIGRHYQKKFQGRLTIIHSDALKYIPPKGLRYGMVWHDIWDDMTEDNLPQMHALHRKYGRLTQWQGSWGRELIEARKRRSYSIY